MLQPQSLRNSTNAETPYPWQPVYQAAVLETDSRRLPDRLASANAVLQQRSRELDSCEATAPERRRLTEALLTLDLIRRIEATYPGWITQPSSQAKPAPTRIGH
jgi:hypothetical protein